MIPVTINNKQIKVPEDLSVLEAVREQGIHIPTLCYHEALEAVGSCRLCIVEVEENGRTRTAASCVTPLTPKMIIRTDTEKILKIRRILVELLMARCPGLKVLEEMAEEMGVRKVRFVEENDDCFLCGQCVRACSEIVGVSAIGFSDRGVNNQISAPFLKASNVCISCGTCTTICPAGTFHLERVDNLISLHRYSNEYHQEKCRVCGDHFVA